MALIATRNRPRLLRERSLPSIAAQWLAPSVVVLVNDGESWIATDTREFVAILTGIPLLTVQNGRSPGAGGAWNTGLACALTRQSDAFVAILDDDDEWDPAHLAVNAEAAVRENANLVVSGLRMHTRLGVVPRPLLTRLWDRDFLIGNPGWQGSNTFVQGRLLANAGGFRESLRSTHDRDLAIRILRHPWTRPALVPLWTATWHMDSTAQLSEPGNPDKLAGLREFYRLYGAEMTPPERREFFDRASRLFGFTADDVVSSSRVSRPARATGDLHERAGQ